MPGDTSPPETDPRAHTTFNRLVHRGEPFAVRLRYRNSDFGSSAAYMSETFGQTDASLCVLQLHDFPEANAWREGRHFRQPALEKNAFVLLDLREAWQTEVSAPFDNIHLNITRSMIDETADDLERPTALAFASYAAFRDETLFHLALSLMPALRRPAEVNALFTAHVTSAAVLHLLGRFGVRRVARRITGGLAPWQARRARDYIRAHLDTDVDLKVLAETCGLSPTHFAKAFKRTMGVPPHRWLLRQRVERAQELLLASTEPLHAIALACGFADQSHMTRVFGRAVGTTPGAWRRVRRS